VILSAQQEAAQLNAEKAGPEHLLLALVGEGLAAEVLTKCGVDLGRARREAIAVLVSGKNDETEGDTAPRVES